MDVGETLYVATREERRRWLAERHRGEAVLPAEVLDVREEEG
ncbi:MAG: hypothetical protein V3W11_04950 [bacterium]